MFKHKFLIFLLGLMFMTVNSGFGLASGYTPRVGEIMDYHVIAKSVIYGADQRIKVVSKGTYQGREIVNLQLEMATIGMMQNIQKYSEKEELILDVEGLYPWYLKREVNQGDKQKVEEVTFDYARGIAIRNVSKNNGSKYREELKLPGFVQDSLSLPYFLRKEALKSGQHQIYFYNNGDIETIRFQATKVNQPLKLDCGTFSQYWQISNAESKITVMLADNAERQPLIIQKVAQFGKVEARLVKYN